MNTPNRVSQSAWVGEQIGNGRDIVLRGNLGGNRSSTLCMYIYLYI